MLLKTHGVVCSIGSTLTVGEKYEGKKVEKKPSGSLSPAHFAFFFNLPGILGLLFLNMVYMHD